MKFRTLVNVLAAFCLVTVLTSTPVQAGPSAFAGLSLPTGSFGDAAKLGIHFGGAFSQPVAPLIKAGLRGAFNRWSWDGPDGSFNTVELLAFARISTPTGVFGMGGVGLSSSDGELDGEGLDRQTDFCFALGGGYGLTLLKLTLLYHSVQTDGGSTNYLTLSAGIGF